MVIFSNLHTTFKQPLSWKEMWYIVHTHHLIHEVKLHLVFSFFSAAAAAAADNFQFSIMTDPLAWEMCNTIALLFDFLRKGWASNWLFDITYFYRDYFN